MNMQILYAQYAPGSPAYLHYPLFPASDHFLLANLEPERFVPVAR